MTRWLHILDSYPLRFGKNRQQNGGYLPLKVQILAVIDLMYHMRRKLMGIASVTELRELILGRQPINSPGCFRPDGHPGALLEFPRF